MDTNFIFPVSPHLAWENRYIIGESPSIQSRHQFIQYQMCNIFLFALYVDLVICSPQNRRNTLPRCQIEIPRVQMLCPVLPACHVCFPSGVLCPPLIHTCLLCFLPSVLSVLPWSALFLSHVSPPPMPWVP